MKFNNIKLSHKGKEISIAQHYSQYGAVVCQEVFDGEEVIVFKEDLDTLIDALIKIRDKDTSCYYCGGNCPNDNEYMCDGYSGNIDNLY